MFCHKCGKSVPENVSYCRHCGVKLHTPLPQPHLNLGLGLQLPEKSEKYRNISKSVTAIGLVIIILASLGVGLWFFGGGVQNKAEQVVYVEVYDGNHRPIANASGFFIADGRTLVTNYHVIDGAGSLEVYTADGNDSVSATMVLAYDRAKDLAILRCDEDLGVNPLRLADSDKVKQGDKVYAVGYPLGLANTMSDGIISSKYSNEGDADVLQITAAISPGSSGGALLNTKGEVVGVICATRTDGQNVNFAIGANTLRQLYESRLKTAITLTQLNR